MDALFQEMTRILLEARQAVQAEAELHARSRSIDSDHLRRLRRSVGDFLDRADSLVLMMRDRETDAALVHGAEELCCFFRDTAGADRVPARVTPTVRLRWGGRIDD